jgi:hypothetical protein
MREIPIAGSVLAFAVLAGCVATSGPPPRSYIPVNSTPRPLRARTIDSVALYRVSPPEASFVEVAWLSARGSNDVLAVRRLRANAAGIGCDGLVVHNIGDAMTHTTDLTPLLGKQQPTHRSAYVATARGSCIVFEVDPHTWVVPPASTNPQSCKQHFAVMEAQVESGAKLRALRKIPSHCHAS